MYIFKSGKSVCVTVCRSGYQCVIILGPVGLLSPGGGGPQVGEVTHLAVVEK